MKHPTEAEISEAYFKSPSWSPFTAFQKGIEYALSLQSKQEGKVWTDGDMIEAWNDGHYDASNGRNLNDAKGWLTEYKKTKQ